MKRLWRYLPLTTWLSWRRGTQLAALALFLWLFRQTQSDGTGHLSGLENLFFRMDPLLAAATMLGMRTLLWIFWPAIVLLLATVLLGRFFCGWICPMGTLLDGFARLVRPLTRRLHPRSAPWVRRLRPARYALLLIVLLGALLALPVAGWLDPFALLTRGLTFWVDPTTTRGLSDAPLWVRMHLLPSSHKAYALAALAGGMLGALFLLELIARRFWCRYLCPLGALLGVCGRFAPVQRVPARVCGKCPARRDCGQLCRMDAFDQDRKLIREDCTLCMECVTACTIGLAHFGSAPKAAPAPVQLSRRVFLGSVTAGVALPAVAYALRLPAGSAVDPTLLRPPGAGSERDFLNRCARCGLCMKVCPTNALQPLLFEAGLDGLFSPRLDFRTGYCDFGCTLCGQVCPTGAIPRLLLEQKVKTVIGKAVLDTERCLPWATDEPCRRCHEQCPVDAIRFEPAGVARAAGRTAPLPRVCFDACIGCGICENVCPVRGKAAVAVRRTESVRHERRGPHGDGRGEGRGQGLGRRRRQMDDAVH